MHTTFPPKQPVLKEKLKYAIHFCKSIDTDDYARVELQHIGDTCDEILNATTTTTTTASSSSTTRNFTDHNAFVDGRTSSTLNNPSSLSRMCTVNSLGMVEVNLWDTSSYDLSESDHEPQHRQRVYYPAQPPSLRHVCNFKFYLVLFDTNKKSVYFNSTRAPHAVCVILFDKNKPQRTRNETAFATGAVSKFLRDTSVLHARTHAVFTFRFRPFFNPNLTKFLLKHSHLPTCARVTVPN